MAALELFFISRKYGEWKNKLYHTTKKQTNPACGTTYRTIGLVSATIQGHGTIKKQKEYSSVQEMRLKRHNQM